MDSRVALEEEALLGSEDPAADVVQRVEVLTHLDQALGFIPGRCKVTRGRRKVTEDGAQ